MNKNTKGGLAIGCLIIAVATGCSAPTIKDAKLLLREASDKAKKSQAVTKLDQQLSGLIGDREFHLDQRDYSDSLYRNPRRDGFGFDIGGLRSKARASGDYAAAYYSQQRANKAASKSKELKTRRYELIVKLTETYLGPNLGFVDQQIPNWRTTVTDQ